MNLIIVCALSASIVISVMRNLLSKSVSGFSFGTAEFFGVQSALFAGGFFCLLIPALTSRAGLSGTTLIYSLIYAALLIAAQWNYTLALKTGNISLCATVYSLGFVIPVIAGTLLFHEYLNLKKVVGIAAAVLAVIVSGAEGTLSADGKTHILPLLLSTAASGGLGIIQKLWQHSQSGSQLSAFLALAFLLACCASFICRIAVSDSQKCSLPPRSKVFALATGICFGCCNLLNTFLAGRLSCAFFFPVQNVSVIILSSMTGFVIFREKFGKRELSVLLLGICAVFLTL